MEITQVEIQPILRFLRSLRRRPPPTYFVTCTVTQGQIQLACLLDSHTLRSGVCSHVCGACMFLRSQHSSHLAGSNWAGVVMDVAQQAGVKQGQIIKGLSSLFGVSSSVIAFGVI